MEIRQMNSLECSYIAKELASLEAKHFSKAYSLGGDSFRLKLGDSQIIAEPPSRVCIAKYIRKETEPSQFVQKMRKILGNQKLERAYQCGNDRIIALKFEENILFIELFAKGNAILADKGGKILAVLRQEKWKDRTLAPGEIYKEPPGSFALDVRSSLSEKYAIVCLLRLQLGKDYAKEMLDRCGIEEKKPGNSLSEPEISCLESQREEILKNQKPWLFLKNGKPVDFSLARLKKYSTLEAREMRSLSEAMEEYYASAPSGKKSEKLEKLQRRLETQLAALEKLKQDEKEAREKGDFIYSNFQQIEQILSAAKKAGIKNAREALKNCKIIAIDEEKKELEIEF